MIKRFYSSLVLLGLSYFTYAGEPNVSPTAPPLTSTENKSVYDRIWGLAQIYKNEANPVLQEFALQGRLHLQWATGHSDQGHYGSDDRPEESLWGDIEVRRWRLGFKSKWFSQFKLEGQIDVSPNFDPEFYSKIYDLHLTWAPRKEFNIGIGKYKSNFFSLEQATSSNQILTFERSLLANTLFAGELTGIKVNGTINSWIYTLGVYAGDDQREFTRWEAGTILQAGIGYDFSHKLNFKKAMVKLDYQHSDDVLNAGGGSTFEHAFSLNSSWEQGRWSLYTDFLMGNSRDSQGDVWGAVLIPAVSITDRLQAVLRYQYAQGQDDALRLQNRYERLAPDLSDGGKGDEYQALYLGLNYYLYDHKLKLMAGTEYHTMKGGENGGSLNGWTTMVGLRLSF